MDKKLPEKKCSIVWTFEAGSYTLLDKDGFLLYKTSETILPGNLIEAIRWANNNGWEINKEHLYELREFLSIRVKATNTALDLLYGVLTKGLYK